MMGKLFIQDYRLIQFLAKDTFLLQSMSFSGGADRVSYVVQVLESNYLADNRPRRIQVLTSLREIVKNLGCEGLTRVLLLYINNGSYSELAEKELQENMAPVVTYLRNELMFHRVPGGRKIKAH